MSGQDADSGKNYRIETALPNGTVISGEPVLDKPTGEAWIEDLNKRRPYGSVAQLKRGPFMPESEVTSELD